MKKETGFKIIVFSMLTYAVLLTLVSFSQLMPSSHPAAYYARIPILANVLCLISLLIGIYLIIKGD